MTTKHYELKKRIYEKLKELNLGTFTSEDVAKLYGIDNQIASAIMRDFVKRGKLQVLAKVHGPKGYQVNIHAFPDYRIGKRDRSGNVLGKLNDLPMTIHESMENWQEVWPEMFKLPDELIRKPGQYKKHVHIQEA